MAHCTKKRGKVLCSRHLLYKTFSCKIMTMPNYALASICVRPDDSILIVPLTRQKEENEPLDLRCGSVETCRKA